ncbi:Spb1 C-terminal domain-containing protein [Cladochytrium replicatum]|nr:Spb1 C-terminal domain-containing protein [Cladochytrium replicatum]
MARITKKHAKGRLDKYYHMAKEQGYRARSAFKLIQLNRKYNFLERSKCLIDLCAAPGGWLQVAAKYMPRQSIVVGLDLNPIKPIPGVVTLVEDITTAKCRSSLKKELKTWKADVVLHDGAPNVGTSWLQDAFTQNELVLSSLKLATEFLVPGGTFVSKVFRSKDYNKLMWVLHQLFKKVEATKPQSSRNVSAEIFVVCREYLAPKKIDEKLLDAKWVFKEMDDNADVETDEKKIKEKQSAVLNELLHPEKRRRHRDGYEDGDYTLHKSRSITDFIKGSDFVHVLAKSNELRFDQDDDGKVYANHPLTTEEIKQCCKDLRVLGKRDFKDLLKWRQEIRISLGIEEKQQDKVTRKLEEAKKEEEGDLAELIAAESNELLARAKRLERKSKDRKAKQLMKLRFGMETPMEIGIEASASMGFEEDQSLFSVKETPGKAPGENEAYFSEDEDQEEKLDWEDEDDAAGDSDDERAARIAELERDVDELYEEYKERQIQKDKKAMARKEKKGAAKDFEDWYGIEWENKMKEEKAEEGGKLVRDGSDDDFSDSSSDSDVEQTKSSKRKRAINSKRSDDEDEDDDGEVPALSKKAKLFFQNPVFGDAMQKASIKDRHQKRVEEKSMFDVEMSDLDSKSESEEESIKTKSKKNQSGTQSKKSDATTGKPTSIVTKFNGSEDEDDGERQWITNFQFKLTFFLKEGFEIATAETYTMAQNLLTVKGKRDMIDGSFNRYAYNDPEGLPEWFMDDENRHNKPQMPVTKEAIEIMRAKMQELNARPIKKVMEAKFRKKLRTMKKLEKLQKKAQGILEDNEEEEGGDRRKLQTIRKMMRNATKGLKARPKVNVVVAKGSNRGISGRPKGVKGKYKMVDPRMKKEVKAQKRRAKQQKGRKRK